VSKTRATPGRGGEQVDVFIAFGSNVGNRVAALRTAVEVLRESGVEPHEFSSLYHSRPKYVTDQPPFVNGVGRFRTSLAPHDLLDACQRAEAAAGRQKRERYGPRELDVDILLYGDLIVAEEGLRIPHPGIPERLFVLEPLTELRPDLQIPGMNGVTDLRDAALAALPEEERVVALGAFVPERGRPLDGALDSGE
jgi:2-amino-4-hydroxy-6-hydroxymethyldihydropteridine diphosphokinase